ncbi:MAG TPA: response regulator [Terracidiphilus sp.]|nr:response regulator [Terracidiphilus sp.]
MKGKILIVEDEPIVALDLHQEITQMGCEVVGVAESSDEALLAVSTCWPDLALMDIRIAGSMDGIQTARLLSSLYETPSIFLTSYSDEITISRAARAMPYGYLTKPFQSGELKATMQVALHKARLDARQNAAQQKMARTMDGMREGVLLLSSEGRVLLMNQAAEVLSGWTLLEAKDKLLREILMLSDINQRAPNLLEYRDDAIAVEEFGWTLNRPGGGSTLVDISLTKLANGEGQHGAFVVTVRDAAQRVRTQAMEETLDETHSFDQTPTAMVQLDKDGRIARVNEALLHEAGVKAESLLGRTLTGLSMDPDPRIAKDLMHKMLQSGTFVATPRPRVVN